MAIEIFVDVGYIISYFDYTFFNEKPVYKQPSTRKSKAKKHLELQGRS